jgi:hypothetical protein
MKAIIYEILAGTVVPSSINQTTKKMKNLGQGKL